MVGWVLAQNEIIGVIDFRAVRTHAEAAAFLSIPSADYDPFARDPGDAPPKRTGGQPGSRSPAMAAKISSALARSRYVLDWKIQRTTPSASTSTAVGYAMSPPSSRPPRWRMPRLSRSTPF
jgi:hypothetical protein